MKHSEVHVSVAAGLSLIVSVLVLTSLSWCTFSEPFSVPQLIVSHRPTFYSDEMADYGNERSCTMCPFTASNLKNFCNHLVRVHRKDPRFRVVCDLGNCGFATKSWNSYKSHLSKHHKDNISVCDYVDIQQEHIPMEIENCQTDAVHVDQGMANAAYLLQLASHHNLTQAAINDVAMSTEDLLNMHMLAYKDKIRKELELKGIDAGQVIPDITVDVMFSHLKSADRRKQFYKANCGMVVPSPVLLGTELKNIKGIVKQVKRHGYIVPFVDTIQSLLRMPEVLSAVETPHTSKDEFLMDICDGSYVKSNPLFVDHPDALQIIFNSDDLELVNPLGSHTKKHKVTMFYFTLANLPPECRSRLTAVYLVAIAKTQHLKKWGFGAILQDFIESVNQMSTTGVVVHVNGVDRNTKGAVVMVTGDTLGTNWLGGFKEGVGFAHKPCRTCKIKNEDMAQTFTDGEFHYRSAYEHEQQCKMIFDGGLTKQAQEYWSTDHGINRRSILCDLINFNIIDCLVHDPMHVLLEGTLPYEIALFFKHCIESKYFSLKWLNYQISAFPYSTSEDRSIPEIIERKHIFTQEKIKQTSSATLTLCYILPFLIGHKVPQNDSKWKTLVKLLAITQLVTSPCVTLETVNDLQLLITEHHTNFNTEYPASTFKPKMHYMCHLPRQIQLFGPGRYQWCMRFEAKHCFFTSGNWKNFKNIPLSMSNRHQTWLCSEMMSSNGKPSPDFLYGGDEVSSGEEILVDNLSPNYSQAVKSCLPCVTAIFHPSNVKIQGSIFKPGCIVLGGYDSDRFPQFLYLEQIYIHEHKKYFLVRPCNIVDVASHLMAYEITFRDDLEVISYGQLFMKLPLVARHWQGKTYVQNKIGFLSCDGV